MPATRTLSHLTGLGLPSAAFRKDATSPCVRSCPISRQKSKSPVVNYSRVQESGSVSEDLATRRAAYPPTQRPTIVSDPHAKVLLRHLESTCGRLRAPDGGREGRRPLVRVRLDLGGLGGGGEPSVA